MGTVSSRRLSPIAVLLLSSLSACAVPEGAQAPAEASEYPVEASPATSTLVAACSGTTGQWSGCRGHGCAVCSETTQAYPYYFANHPLCDKNLTCDGVTATCNSNCPAPSNADKEPAPGQCNGTSGQWAGCRGDGCSVCTEKLVDYPYYFLNHPKCVANPTCAGQFFTCNSNCPAPVDADKLPPAGTCNGTSGQWSGCRGSGCAVCAEKLAEFPNYFKNHPNCVKNTTCAGQFFTCNSNCPAPTDADRAPPAPQCDGTAGQWAGCRGNGCAVCGEVTQRFPYYFANHPTCDRNLTCDGQFFTCNAKCPAPVAADAQPAAGVCSGTPGQWSGCRGNGCAVCSEKLVDHPYYFLHHPRCARNDTCAGQFFICNKDCPAPTDAEKQPPAGTCAGTSGQWAGCRGNGCAVCAEKLAQYPNYFKNHPNCVKNTTCAGQFFTCNSNCPAPTDADKGIPAADLFTKPATAFCPSAVELAIAADNKWEVYGDGVRLKPTDTANLESDWRKPAKYTLSLPAGTHVFAVHAADTTGGKTGLIANVRMLGLPYGGGLTDASTRWRVLPAGATPPSNWTTAPSLSWDVPPVVSTACQTTWGQDATFVANWRALAGDWASPRAWVWNRACDSTQSGWQKDNWYRLVVDVRCETGSTTCPEGTACPLRDANGVIQDVGICRKGTCGALTCDELTLGRDAAGNPTLPGSVADLAVSMGAGEAVDTDVGVVSTSTDGEESVGACKPAVGEIIPTTDQSELLNAQNAVNLPITDLGLSITPAQVINVAKSVDDPSGPYRAQVLAAAQLPNPVWQSTQDPIPGGYTEPAHCDGQRVSSDPFGGRDIIFVHGFDPTALMGKQLHLDETRASRTWRNDREDFYSGYYKELANTYWHDHLERYLAGKSNRYLTVAWSSNERMDVAVSAMLTQVSDAMRTGRGVIATPQDGRRRNGFCIPNCVVISHSTGGLVTDLAMTVANETPALKFIPDHVKTHVAMEGAFGGSPFATIAIAIGQALNAGGLLGAQQREFCSLVVRLLGGGGCPQTMPEFTRTILMDLVPSVSQAVWGPMVARTPVPTLTANGGHATKFFPVLKILFPGFDDDTLTSDSSCANPISSWVGPSGYVATGPFAVYDLGIPLRRGVNYWIDQKVDPWFFLNASGFAAAGCTSTMSPTGMLQPVQMELGAPFSPYQRIPNHFSFLQSAAAHSIANLSDLDGRDYDDAWGARSFEETRVITDASVYTRRGNDLRSKDGRDSGVLISSAVKTMQRERVKGWRIPISFSLFGRRISKTFWIWKRRYHNMDGQGDKDQGDYLYQHVVPASPTPASTATSCVSGNVTVRASGVDSRLGSVMIGYTATFNQGGFPSGTFISCSAGADWSAMQAGCGVTAGESITTARVRCDAAAYNGTRRVDRILLTYRDKPSDSVACNGQRTCDVPVPVGGGVDATCVFIQ